jgi:hypothetical protein
LAKENDRSINWVKSKLAKAQSLKKEIKPDGYVMIADCTFFGRGYSFIIFRAVELKKNIYINSLMFETIYEYQKGKMHIEKLGFKIKAIVLDGRPGARNIFNDVPVQMCHFHQKQIVQRVLNFKSKIAR